MKRFRRRVLVFTIGALLGLVLIEITLRVLWSPPNFYGAEAYADYTAEELTPPVASGAVEARLGARCVTAPSRAWNYHPYFGFHRRQLDQACARAHFAGDRTISVVYLGGSTMANAGAPNARTTIDFYVAQALPNVSSVNLAESGSRSTNELIRLLLEVVNLRPRVVVFLDGYNEFNAIRYGGRPEEDFYWAVAVSHLVYRRYTHYLLDAMAERVRLIELVAHRTGLARSSRGARPQVEQAQAAAEYYLDNVERIMQVCHAYAIRCLMFLQPHVFAKPHRSPTEVGLVAYFRRARPEGARILNDGYGHIRSGARVRGLPIVDLSQDAGPWTLFFDEVHLNKAGNRMVARVMAEEIRRAGVLPSALSNSPRDGISGATRR